MPERDARVNVEFNAIDADAICEQCGTVNPEDTLLCKTCGNNLRDQRLRRISGEQSELEGGESRFRLFTGLLTTLGILLIVAAVLNLESIEAWLVSMQTETPSGQAELWSGENSRLYEDMMRQLRESPTPQGVMQASVENPVIDTAYNGRYVLVRPNRILGTEYIGEALLSRRGELVYFVASLAGGRVEVRGYASFGEKEGRQILRAPDSAGIRIDGQTYAAFGWAEPREDGSHAVYGKSFHDDGQYGVLAYRVR